MLLRVDADTWRRLTTYTQLVRQPRSAVLRALLQLALGQVEDGRKS